MDGFGLSTHMRLKLDSLPPPNNLDYPKDLIRLDHAENELIRPELVGLYKDAVASSMNEDVLAYPPGFGGDPVLLKALAAFFNQYFDPAIEVTADHISTSSGSGNSLDALLCTVCDDGDNIMILGPFWFGYGLYTKFHTNVTPIIVNSPSIHSSLSPDCISRLETAYENTPDKTRIKALLVCNPNNPSDGCYSAEVLRGLMAFCHKRDLHYISDEIQALCVFDDSSTPFVSALSLLKDPVLGMDGAESLRVSRTHVFWSLSKDFGSPGVRLGCVISQANRPLLTGVTYSTWWQTSTLTTLYTTTLLTSPLLPSLISLNRTRLQASYKHFTTALRKLNIEYQPVSAGVSIWVKLGGRDVGTGEEEEEEEALVERLREGGVLVAAGKGVWGGWGERGWVRILFAVREELLDEVLRRVEKVLGSTNTS